MNKFIGATVGFISAILFIWLYGAFINWDIWWVQEVHNWSHDERVAYSFLWLPITFLFTIIGAWIADTINTAY